MRSIILLFAVLICTNAIAGEINKEFIATHLKTKTYDLDPEAGAVVLYEKATVEIVATARQYYQQVLHVYRVVKILKTSAIEEADVSEIYYSSGSFHRNMSKIDGATYNLSESGEVVKTDLDKSAIHSRKLGEDYNEVKFTLPVAKAGSIIEYSYDITSDMSLYLPDWDFQNEYPTLRSEYEINYPIRYHYVFVTQGMPPFKEFGSLKEAQKSDAVSYQVAMPSRYEGCSMMLWGRRDVPPLKEEPYISSLRNHVEHIDLQLMGYDDQQTSMRQKVVSDWELFNKRLLEDDEFGGFLKANRSAISKIADSLTKDKQTPRAKSKAIFSYARNFRCEDTIALYTQKRNADVLRDRSGNAAEINLLLVALLQEAGLDAAPVVLSTWGNQKVNELYPFADRFNHVVATVKTDTQAVYLDAANKFNPYGVLPVYCYNGHARIVENKGKGVSLTSNMIKEKDVYSVNIPSITDTAIRIEVKAYYGTFTGRSLRQSWDKNKNNKKTFMENIVQDMGDDVELVSYTVENDDNPDTTLVVKCTLRQKMTQPLGVLHVNTDYVKLFDENPFKAMQRRLPIELPYKMEYVYVLNMNVPENLEPEEMPTPAKINFENGLMTYAHLFSYNADARILSVSSKYVATETEYSVESYGVIRQFFEKMMTENNKMLTLKIKQP